MYGLLVFISILTSLCGFHFQIKSFSVKNVKNNVVHVKSQLHLTNSYRKRSFFKSFAKKADLFSDDLFDEDDENESKSSDSDDKTDSAPKRKYVEEDWKLSDEDTEEFKGFPEKTDAIIESEKIKEVTIPKTTPTFALFYQLKREYMETDIKGIVDDHLTVCGTFKRIIGSEVINLGKAKGVVILWMGMTGTDMDETRADIMSFMEKDPFVAKDMVKKWDLADLTLPSNAAKAAARNPVTSPIANKLRR